MNGDRDWSVAPTFLWFGAAMCVVLAAFDHSPRAVADRLAKHTAPKQLPGAAGPLPAAPPVEVADATDEDTATKPSTAPVRDAHAAAAGSIEDTCVDGTPDACKRWAMDGFYQAIAGEKAGKLDRPVRISWYGDSVVATDAIPGRLRSRMQTELGDGGPGYVFVVPPHRFCGHDSITRGQSGTWLPHAISTLQVADGLYGAGGSTAETEDGRATIKLVAGKVTRAELYYLSQPHGGSVAITADGTEVARADTKAEVKAPGYAVATIDGGAAKFDVVASGRVRVFGLDLENAKGAVVDNLGIISVNVKSFDHANTAHFTDELAHRSADLVMIMIGANEAQWLGPKDQDTKDYAAHYEKILAPIRKARPEASCLVVSPTDQAEEKDGAYPSRPVMPILVAAQRAAAKAQGCAFFSTYDWMGGKGSAEKWFRHGLVGTDFQHLSRKGANKLADAVFTSLMAGNAQYGK
ncbi:MAG TPA: GDSL-type esterase/lipase family protein [Kofleriaceae bacterium]|jgi:lysophospholipase L1-like esterase